MTSAKTRPKKFKPFESSFLISCPICKEKAFTIVQRLDLLPYFGEVLETFASCSSCDYKTSDVLPIGKGRAPPVQTKTVTKEADLSLRIVKSKNAIIEIPEIGLKIEPGPDSEAFITNVEGLFDRIIEQVHGFEELDPDSRKEYESIVKRLKEMKNLKEKFTLIIKDATGQSAILNEKKNK